MNKRLEDKMREKALQMIYRLGMSTAKTYTRLGAFESEADAEVYNMVNQKKNGQK